MSLENAVSNLRTDLDDSGCVQDDSIQNGTFQTNLLDMPDDVLLYILQSLKARDLKALGYCSRRLCRLVQEKALWRYVDARDDNCSRVRFKWFLDNVLQTDTQVLLLSGYARDVDGCLGFMNLSREEGERMKNSDTNWNHVEHFALQLSSFRNAVQGPRKVYSPNDYWFRRCSGLPSWGDSEVGKKGPQSCIGPQFSLSLDLLQDLCNTCPKLHTLALEFCNIDCRTTNLDQFPKSLKKLSLRGSKCYNMVMDKTFLFRINSYLPDLESLDVSECQWMDPATLLPLSKLASLHELFAQKCVKMTEFVAYASLTARYGFKSLKSLDLRGSPVGDSEVSALGWLPSLEKLWLSASKNMMGKSDQTHAHFIDDLDTNHVQLHEWEIKEQSFYREKPENIYYYYDDEDMEIKEKDSSKRKPEAEKENDGESNKKRLKLDQDTAFNESNDKETINNKTVNTHNEDNDKFVHPSTSKSEINKDDKRDMNKETGESSSSSTGNEDAPSEENNKNGGHALDNVKERSVVDCIKIDGLLNCGDILRCDDHGEVIVFASRKRTRVQSPAQNGGHVRFRRGERPVVINASHSESDNSDNKLNLKRSLEVNEGASTSRQEPDTSESKTKPEINHNQNRNQQNQENERVNEPIDYRIEPRHHVLYVNVGPQINTYRFPREVLTPEFTGIRDLNMQRRHIEASSLVTDFAIRRFGRADGEDVNIIHIGPNGPVVFGQDMASRPDRSNLRFLSVNGYRNITDRSLVHLATAAPNLTEIDFSDTNVTESGAESFRGLRPDCKLVYTKFMERED